MDKNIIKDRIRGSLIGGAIGDALGYPVEFIYSFGDIQRRYGRNGITRLDTHQWWLEEDDGNGKAVISDDTQMTLFTACGLLNAKAKGMAPRYAICYAYIEWLFTQIGWKSRRYSDCWISKIPELNKRRAPGNTCITSLNEILAGREPNNDSKGCGGVMRTAPVALYGAVWRNSAEGEVPVGRISNIQDVDRLAAEAAEITHQHPLGRGTPQGGVISPLLSNIYLHWFETCAMLTAKATGQVMSIVRYADDFVILARKLREDFVQKIERELEGRFGLTVNREKTKVVDLVKKGVSLEFLGYEFRYVRGIHHTWYGTEDKWLWFGPSMKSVKKVCAKVKELTLGRMNKIPIRDTIQKLNVILKGWSNYFNGGYPNPRYLRVNDYVRKRLIILSKHTSQRRYKLKYAQSYYYEWKAMGLYEMRKRRAQ